ncbi:MAG: DUF2158 domain-containing protein [Boseongicola sp.]|nr:DUF2158 domain-containing protein [Boseongicola sp.]
MTDAPRFSPGDVVRLKSGGPPMTVESVVSGDVATCVWFSEERKFNTMFVMSTLVATTVDADERSEKRKMQ